MSTLIAIIDIESSVFILKTLAKEWLQIKSNYPLGTQVSFQVQHISIKVLLDFSMSHCGKSKYIFVGAHENFGLTFHNYLSLETQELESVISVGIMTSLLKFS